jgi:hypothetical protein
MKTKIGIVGAAILLMAGSMPASAEPDRGGRADRGGPSAKVERPNFDRDRSERRSFDVDRRRGADAEGQVRERRDGSRRGGKRDRDFVVRHGHRHVWGGVTFYLSDGYYYGECDWLKRRAIRTGNPVWWSRYRRCRDFS